MLPTENLATVRLLVAGVLRLQLIMLINIVSLAARSYIASLSLHVFLELSILLPSSQK